MANTRERKRRRTARRTPLRTLRRGVRRHPEIEEALIVDRHVARWFALQFLHLIGYRKQRAKGDTLVVLRRRFDLPTGV